MKSLLTRLATPALFSLLCLAAAPGCTVLGGTKTGDNTADNGDDTQLAQDAAALTAGSSQSAGLGQVLLSPIQAEDMSAADVAAQAVETRPITGLSPEGCATKTRDGDKVHVEFNSCTGPYGLVRLDGGVDVTFSVTATGGLHADLKSVDDLTLQDRPLTYSATADLTASGTERTLVWAGQWNTETLAGAPVEHSSSGELTVDLATSCVAFTGKASGSIDERGIDLTIDDLNACPAVCPASGTITATGKVSKTSVSVTFDGSAKAAVTGPKGNTFSVALSCTPG
jgi:hypothetical protein